MIRILEIKMPNYLLKINFKKTLLVHGNRIKPYYFGD